MSITSLLRASVEIVLVSVGLLLLLAVTPFVLAYDLCAGWRHKEPPFVPPPPRPPAPHIPPDTSVVLSFDDDLKTFKKNLQRNRDKLK